MGAIIIYFYEHFFIIIAYKGHYKQSRNCRKHKYLII